MKKTIIILISIFCIVMLGTFVSVRIYNSNMEESYNMAFDNNMNVLEQNIEILSIETSKKEEKTTPNTLITYKIYYTKCKHYIQKYEDIDMSLVNLTEKEFKEKFREWDVDKFSSEEIEMSKEKEAFCGEHYKLKLENESIVIYNIDENGIENEYEYTGITTEYLTEQDILKFKTGVYVFGKENLTSTIEDFE